jgi:predicted metal-dependent hydrolase
MEYRLRVSRWARGLSLRVTARGGVEVIGPRRYSPATIARLLSRERAWIESALAEVEARRRALPPPPPWQVPAEIVLPAVQAAWEVRLCPSARPGVRVTAGAKQLELAGQVADRTACRRALLRWLVRQAGLHLVPRLEDLSRSLGLPYAGTTLRLPRTRWGSCSRAGIISLNARLLLLPAPLADYVLIHELCHTRELNHSRKFWRLVGQHCPDYDRRRIALRQAGKQLPEWARDREEDLVV